MGVVYSRKRIQSPIQRILCSKGRPCSVSENWRINVHFLFFSYNKMFKLCICVSSFVLNHSLLPIFSINKALVLILLDTKAPINDKLAFIYFIHDASIVLRISPELTSVKLHNNLLSSFYS